MRTQLIVRGDGNQRVGLGHMYRLLALCEMLTAFDKTFVITHDTDDALLPSDVKRLQLPEVLKQADEPAHLAQIFLPAETSIVIDGYQFDNTYLKDLCQLGFRVIYIDDLMKDENPAHVIINHAIGIHATDYKSVYLNQFGIGTKYALLRPAFLKRAGKPRAISTTDNVFICFGGADPFDLTAGAVKALLEVKPTMNIQVVIGAAYNHQLLDSIAQQNNNVVIHKSLNEEQLANVMLSCSFGLVSASTIAYEACAIQMPLLAGYYVDNQKQLYKGLVENELVFGLGDISQFKHTDFKQIFVEVLSRSLAHLMKAQAKHFDAHITQRVNWLFRDITYRLLNESDVNLVYNWANDPVIRANSYQTDTIPFETHQTWFTAKLQDKNCLMYMCMYEGQAAGMLRYQVSEGKSVVGIQIGEEYRGKKLAVPMLIDTARFYFRKFSEPIFAYIKVENEASKNAFEKAGYKYVSHEVVSGCNSYCYRLDKVDV